MTDLRSLLPEQLAEALAPLALPKYRTQQIFSWLQSSGVQDTEGMTNLPKALRSQLHAAYRISGCELVRRQESKHGDTRKYLFRLYDGQSVESVAMQYSYGTTLCISTQAGCKMGCAFCASGKNGLQRDLLPGEMLSQIHAAQRDLGHAVGRVVLMGMGEPLDNYDNTVQFLRLVSHPQGLHLGQRKLSLSTCGLVPQMDRLAHERLGLTLTVSLHAPNDTLRRRLMPINKAYPLGQLIPACERYLQRTGRRVSFEYALFRGVNDSMDCARQLAALLHPLGCHVNLIPANAVPELGFARSEAAQVRAFQETLEQNGVNVTVRRSLGTDISAACGQLRLKTVDIRP